jgi:hypothetical protein
VLAVPSAERARLDEGVDRGCIAVLIAEFLSRTDDEQADDLGQRCEIKREL